MPCDYDKYHHEWTKLIRPAILERAEWCCEMCGLPNHRVIQRAKKNGARTQHVATGGFGVIKEMQRQYDLAPDTEWKRPIVVVLTIAHIDHDITNNDPSNLAALCQRCHLRWDREHHMKTRASNRLPNGQDQGRA